jgi:hypothetical protein
LQQDTKQKMSELQGKLTESERSLLHDLFSAQEAEWQKKLSSIPLLAPLLGAFGLVSTFYGFEKILDQTPLITHPWVLLGIGIFTLLFTGVFYRKL